MTTVPKRLALSSRSLDAAPFQEAAEAREPEREREEGRKEQRKQRALLTSSHRHDNLTFLLQESLGADQSSLQEKKYPAGDMFYSWCFESGDRLSQPANPKSHSSFIDVTSIQLSHRRSTRREGGHVAAPEPQRPRQVRQRTVRGRSVPLRPLLGRIPVPPLRGHLPPSIPHPRRHGRPPSQRFSTDDDLGLTCPLGPGESARCPCASVTYQLFSGPGDRRFILDPDTGVLKQGPGRRLCSPAAPTSIRLWCRPSMTQHKSPNGLSLAGRPHALFSPSDQVCLRGSRRRISSTTSSTSKSTSPRTTSRRSPGLNLLFRSFSAFALLLLLLPLFASSSGPASYSLFAGVAERPVSLRPLFRVALRFKAQAVDPTPAEVSFRSGV
ncbi:hypothetical protein C7M84_015986 [Penaeus vannamei]|uniref:Uncharacterized protein n=1 Tax=Penaeus vannamei TaxID=6689 RepID=A0A423SP61_PENVA|nr:hypothetical protein C7M84_015986 [Penaeus vannamei]